MQLKKTIADLKAGELAVIVDLKEEQLSLKLAEMGCVPGCEVLLCNRAPFGGPVCIEVCGYRLSMRLEDAATIEVENE